MKTILAAVGAAVLAGTITYLVQQRQIEALKTDNQNLMAQLEQAAIEREAASQAAQAVKEDPVLLQKDNAAQQRASQAAAQLQGSPGRYISKDQLAFVGCATPLAALESAIWATINGDYDQYVATHIAAPLQFRRPMRPGAREPFEEMSKARAALFKGIQVVAWKALAEDRVALKVYIDGGDPALGLMNQTQGFMIQIVERVGNDWKLDGMQSYSETWDQDGQAQPLGH